MLIFPLYGICAIALTGLFFPWIEALQEPSIALFYSASAISQDYFKDFSDWLQLSTKDAGRVLSRSFSSLPLVVYLPTPSSSNSNIWNGTKEFIVIPSDSSLATINQLENSLSLLTPFKVHPPRFPPPFPDHESGSAVYNDAGEAFDTEELTNSNDGLPLFLGLVLSVLAAYHLVIYLLWERKLAKLNRRADEAKARALNSLEDLSKAKIVLDKTEDLYLKGVLGGLESTSKQSEIRSSSSSEAQIQILEHLYVLEDSPSAAAPTLFSFKRWTMPKSEFESTYGAIPRASSAERSIVVPQLPIDESSKRKRSDSDSGNGNDDKGPAVPRNVHFLTRQSDSGGRSTVIRVSDHSLTVVPNLHVERPSERKRRSIPKSARHPRPQRLPSRPAVLGIIRTPPMVDIHAGDPSDTNLGRREHVIYPSTTVDIRVEGASDRDLGEPQASIPSESMPSVSIKKTAEPSAMVDIHAEGAPVAKFTGAGSQPEPPIVESGQNDGYDISTSIQPTILAPRTPSAATATATTRVEVQASPQSPTESPQTEQPSGRRRKNRMGQRQRRRLREMRENRGCEAIQQSSQQGDESFFDK
ncbi:uncharacterized protein BHQ10_001442 [Talaromyces amestolkiae]|uniref:Uncharacterized protein n=1 Tax=Talaromyces amestolkiae TaxID=1196081 RepID=A0A364KPE8_TALAM|nr:uncharacterized protein BHQ10_001442 [Talaromyces amestolkiae]RAO65430.1 hypothetical protein BHQ10_001442 [Talaromyces amestolkiae]